MGVYRRCTLVCEEAIGTCNPRYEGWRTLSQCWSFDSSELIGGRHRDP
jgi:hypothetical protein